MNFLGWLLWGFISTIVLTTMMSAGQGMRFTRISLPFMLGTFFTPNRDHAKLAGFIIHLLNGMLFSLVYVLAFEAWSNASWWRGALIGLVHALFVLTEGMRILPGLHPRMASEQHGPSVMKQLEPPGFLALNYGYQTPIVMVFAHVVFGAILGLFYRLH